MRNGYSPGQNIKNKIEKTSKNWIGEEKEYIYFDVFFEQQFPMSNFLEGHWALRYFSAHI